VPVTSGHEMKCGHHEPDIDKESWKAYYPVNSNK